MEIPSYSQVSAAGRHVLTAASSVVATLAVLHLLTGDQAAKVSDALSQISTGLASLITGVTTLVGVGSALYATWTASKSSQIATVAAMPEVKRIVTTQAVATASPSDKVVAQQAPAT